MGGGEARRRRRLGGSGGLVSAEPLYRERSDCHPPRREYPRRGHFEATPVLTSLSVALGTDARGRPLGAPVSTLQHSAGVPVVGSGPVAGAADSPPLFLIAWSLQALHLHSFTCQLRTPLTIATNYSLEKKCYQIRPCDPHPPHAHRHTPRLPSLKPALAPCSLPNSYCGLARPPSLSRRLRLAHPPASSDDHGDTANPGGRPRARSCAEPFRWVDAS